MQAIGADALPVTSAANLLVGSSSDFSASRSSGGSARWCSPRASSSHALPRARPPGHRHRRGGPLGRGPCFELATMQVSEEIDALRSMGFKPVSWLVVRCRWPHAAADLDWRRAGARRRAPRHDRHHRHDATRLRARCPGHITGAHFLNGMIKTPFLGLIIGLIACRQGLAARGSGGRRGAHDHRRRAGHLRRDRDQRALHAVLHAAGNLNVPPSRRTSSSRTSDRVGARVLMEHVSFEVERGTTLAILGGSGSGKSTLYC